MRSQSIIEYDVEMISYRYPPDFVRDLDQSFGRHVRQRRLNMGFHQSHVVTQLSFGYRIRWNQSHLSKVESGARLVKIAEAFALAEILSMTVEDLAFGRGLGENLVENHIVFPASDHGKHSEDPK
jgi:transcriptional regulator with XRE-family HTH domain